MHIIYWAHSYRGEDAEVNQHFGILIENAARMIVNFDPPSESVNESKLSQNLRSCDGMVAVLTWRPDGPSLYILHEIGLCLRSRKPLVVFLDDRLPSDLVPARVLQRRYSYRTYFRQIREHTDALNLLKAYMGDPPPSRYQPSSGQRLCGIIGLAALERERRAAVRGLVSGRSYSGIDLEKLDISNLRNFDRFEYLANLDVSLQFVDATTRRAMYWSGALSAAAIPLITVTTNDNYNFDAHYPREFQPRLAHVSSARPLDAVLQAEFDLFEQNFLKAQSAEAIVRYTKMQVESGALAGNYEAGTRDEFARAITNINIHGPAFGVVAGAHVHDINFSQVWNQIAKDGDVTQLANELRRLREAMETEASDAAQRAAVIAVSAAEQSARQNNGPKAIEFLKMAGKWAFDVAQKIGIELATEAIKGALGMGPGSLGSI